MAANSHGNAVSILLHFCVSTHVQEPLWSSCVSVTQGRGKPVALYCIIFTLYLSNLGSVSLKTPLHFSVAALTYYIMSAPETPRRFFRLETTDRTQISWWLKSILDKFVGFIPRCWWCLKQSLLCLTFTVITRFVLLFLILDFSFMWHMSDRRFCSHVYHWISLDFLGVYQTKKKTSPWVFTLFWHFINLVIITRNNQEEIINEMSC